jgi:hypothetical protein
MTEPTPRTEAREATRARLLAERILDRWHGDPDDDLAILARAVVRLNELAQARTEALDEPCLYPGCGYNALHTARVEP